MRATRLLRVLALLSILVTMVSPQSSQAGARFQTGDRDQLAQQLLESMLPEERVGQLFLVTFQGAEAAPGTENAQEIYDLIVNYHVGGVVLKRENNNFVAPDQTISVLMSLTDQLQRNEYSSSLQNTTLETTGEIFRPVFVPLLIGIEQDGDGFPYDQILSGLTPLPNLMAIGATWQPELARQVGEVLGKELNILGINMIFGPSLDVLEPRYSSTGSDLGVRSFGSDPFWVGEMGRAYVSGLHQGSAGELVVVGKHFPGSGGADRLPNEEVATVVKNLEELKQVDLAPFFAVTGAATAPEAVLDGLLTSHLRYQGLQENLRQTTKPISLDPQALANVMSLPLLSSWQENGGVMITDSLGSTAVRRFYDPTGQTFNARNVALEAFLAGNDMLYLDNFTSSADPDAYTTVTRTLTFFAQKYREDPAFAERVDESALKILKMKLKIYQDQFFLNRSQPAFEQRNQLNRSGQLVFRVASQAATRIGPATGDIDESAPKLFDQIVFITDSRTAQQCDTCSQYRIIAVDALEQAVVRLYSPAAGGQILPRDLTSYSFQDLNNLLEAGIGESEMELSLRQAEWIVVLTLDENPDIPSSSALRKFLEARPELYRDKKLVVFAMNAPYYLDATEISKLSAYYALYSRSNEFIEIVARLLFQEIQPVGDLPVSMPGIGYDLNQITFPDINQIIPLVIENADGEAAETTPTPESTPVVLTYRLGDLIDLRAGVILDHNGRIVPDGTIVKFIITQGGEIGTRRQIEAQTVQGLARVTVRIDSPGNLEFRAESDPAKRSDIIQIVVPMENITGTPEPTPTPTPTGTLEPTLTPTPSPTVEILPTPTPEEPKQMNFGGWVISLVVTSLVGMVSFWMGRREGQLRWGVRTGLLVLIGGSLAYTYLALALPGSQNFLEQNQIAGLAIVAVLGGCIGWLASLVWKQLT